MSKPFKWIDPSEAEIEDAIIRFLNCQVGCMAFKVQTKATFDARIGRYLKLPKNVMPGTPDVLCSYSPPGWPLPIFIGFEVKDADGRQSPSQKIFEQALKDKSNGFYFIVRSMKDAEIALEQVRKRCSDILQTIVNAQNHSL